MLDHLLALVVPPRCVACGAPTPAGQRFCRRCHAATPWLGAGVCPRCALPVPCGPPCPARHAAFAAAWSPTAFDGPARALVHALKFHGRTAAADLMAAQIVANAPAGLFPDGAVLVPVPTHPQRRRARGLDHARLLTRRVARRTGLRAVEVLVRQGPARSQLGAGRAARWAAVRGGVRAAGAVEDAVVLVDDVHTTGATLDACARALREAGATHVAAVTYARTLG